MQRKYEYDLAALEASLKTLDGFKKIMKPFLFIFGGSRSGFEMWNKALVRKVLINHKLADHRKTEKDGENFYQICAFSSKAELSSEWLATKRNQLKAISGDVLRREAMAHGISPHFRPFLFNESANQIVSLSDPNNGQFIYPVHSGIRAENYPVVLYVYAGGQHRFYPVEASDIKHMVAAVAA
jgi:hypothetical protein